jgi:endonuclease/exonuclease/phosphatase family metal-dependent hydrolase
MAWNLRDGLGDPERRDGIVRTVLENPPTVAIFPEAFREGTANNTADFIDPLIKAGYTALRTPYHDDDGRKDRHDLLGIVRTERLAADPSVVRLVGRNALRIPLKDDKTGKTINFIGVHLDDRKEETRQAQVTELLRTEDTDIIAGDFNSMHGRDLRPSMLRLARPIAKLLPATDPNPDIKPKKLERIGSLAERVTGMANGGVMRTVIEAGFEDADPSHPGTKGPFNLDHIMYRDRLFVSQKYDIDTGKLSDHRIVMARLALNA